MINEFKRSQGITLIALVITVIVMLIMAGVAIATISGNGLIAEALVGKGKHTNSMNEEENQIAELLNTIEEIKNKKDFILRNAEDLKWFANEVNNGNTFKGITIELGADIDLGAKENPDGTWSGEEWKPIGIDEAKCFEGIFDGRNREIKGMYVNSKDINAGLFSNNKGIIKDLKILDSYVYSNNTKDIGMLDGTRNNSLASGIAVGRNFKGGKIINVSSNGKIKVECGEVASTCIGGIVGLNISGSSIENASFEGKMEISSVADHIYAGGIAGTNENANIINCNNKGEVKQINVATKKYDAIGGIVGLNFTDSNIENSYNTGNIAYNTTSDITFIGGVSGYNYDAVIKNCYNEGEINGNAICNTTVRIGGVTGSNSTLGQIDNCQNRGTIKGVAKATGNESYVAIGGVNGHNNLSSIIKNSSNMGLIDLSIRCNSTTIGVWLGGVNGYNGNLSETINSYNKGNINAVVNAIRIVEIGGVVGRNTSICSNSYNVGLMTIDSTAEMHRIGGVSGTNNNANTNLEKSYNLGNMILKLNTSAQAYVGGVTGMNYESATSNNCFNKGNIAYDSKGAAALFIGGVSGYNGGSTATIISKINYNYNRGNISGTTTNTGTTYIAGLLGFQNNNSTIMGGYSTGTMSCNKTGTIAGLVAGNNNGGKITSSYYLSGIGTTVNTIANTGTITTSGVKNVSEMKDTTFPALLSTTNYKMDTTNENNGYPILSWE